MFIRFGYEIAVNCAAPRPSFLIMEPHPETIGLLSESRSAPVQDQVLDVFGNRIQRVLLPEGKTALLYDAVLEHSGAVEPALPPDLPLSEVMDLPSEVLPYLNASRYCESDALGQEAWARFGHLPQTTARVQAIFDFVHQHIEFGYPFASAFRTAKDSLAEGKGVCRDFAHLSVALCRAMNIPARYCNGYLGDIGVPFNPAPMDFNAWAEVWIGDRWWTLDARHNEPRIGRILIARGRDAADIPMINTFGPHDLLQFTLWTEEQSTSDLTPRPEVTPHAS